MMSIGVRELKQRTSEVLRRVRQRGEGVEVTVRGEVVALLLPVRRASAERRRATQRWTDLDRLASEIAARWPRGVTATDAVSQGRRG